MATAMTGKATDAIGGFGLQVTLVQGGRFVRVADGIRDSYDTLIVDEVSMMDGAMVISAVNDPPGTFVKRHPNRTGRP